MTFLQNLDYSLQIISWRSSLKYDSYINITRKRLSEAYAEMVY